MGSVARQPASGKEMCVKWRELYSFRDRKFLMYIYALLTLGEGVIIIPLLPDSIRGLSMDTMAYSNDDPVKDDPVKRAGACRNAVHLREFEFQST